FVAELQHFAQAHISTRYVFGGVFFVAFVWLSFERIYLVKQEWKQLQQWNIGGDQPHESALQFYGIFRLYLKTKRIFMYGSLIGAMGVLFGAFGVRIVLQTIHIDGDLLSGSVSGVNLYLSVAEIVLGGLCLRISYLIGRQVHPAKLLIEKMLWLLLFGNKGNDTSEELQRIRDALIVKIEKENPLWFE
ncbi:MAG: hypothetical protein KGM97_10270, partial [Alphaproteobacteria bacterium]|nr:hypothetical protein [Alphaproteobacteria bacterium]